MRVPAKSLDLSPRARDFLDALQGWQILRYDRKYSMHTVSNVTVLDEYLVKNTSQKPLRILPLDPMEGGLQLNRRATDQDGKEWIVMPLIERREILREVFKPAIEWLNAQPNLPLEIIYVIGRDDWKHSLFSAVWLHPFRHDVILKDQLESHFRHLSETFGDEWSDLEACMVALMDFIVGRLRNQHRPWVILPEGIPEGNLVVVRFATETFGEFEEGDALREGLLGRTSFDVPFPEAADGSTHFRLTPPTGSVIANTVVVPDLEGIKEECSRSLIQVYLPPKAEREAGSRKVLQSPPRIHFEVTQTPSLRFITAALHGVVTLLPLVFVTLRGLAPEEVTIWSSLATWDWGAAYAALKQASLKDIEVGVAVSFPLAIGVFGASWVWPSARAFTVAQLIVAVGTVIFWIASGIAPWLAVVGVASGLFFTGFNLAEGIKAMGKVQATPGTWRQTEASTGGLPMLSEDDATLGHARN